MPKLSCGNAMTVRIVDGRILPLAHNQAAPAGGHVVTDGLVRPVLDGERLTDDDVRSLAVPVHESMVAGE